MMSACLLLVWQGHVYFLFVIFGQWGSAWPCRLFSVSLVCGHCSAFVCFECLGYSGLAFWRCRNSVSNPGSRYNFVGVVSTWSH